MRNYTNEKGFTLFEMVISTMLFGLVIALVWNVFFTSYNNYKRISHHNSTLEEMRALTDFMNESVKRAEQVEITIDKKELTYLDKFPKQGEEEQPINSIRMEFKPTKGVIEPNEKSEVLIIQQMAVDETQEALYEVLFLEKPADKKIKEEDLISAIPISNPLDQVYLTKETDSDEVIIKLIKNNPYDDNKPHEYIQVLNLKYKW